MEDIIIYGLVIVSVAYILIKTFKKNGSCGCGGDGNCSKK